MPAVPLDDDGLEGDAPELGHAQLDLARARDELAGAVPASVRLPSAHTARRPRARTPPRRAACSGSPGRSF